MQPICFLQRRAGVEGRNWKMSTLLDVVFLGCSNHILSQLSQRLSYLSLFLYKLCVEVIAGRGMELSKTIERTLGVNLRRQKKAWVSSTIFAWCRSLEVEEMLSIHQQPCQDTHNWLSLEDNKRLNAHPKVKKDKTERKRAFFLPSTDYIWVS